MSNQFLGAALEYLENGFYVFPLMPKTKIPLTQNGFKDASNDPKQIKSWYRQYPNANIGIATGEISGLLVIDLDGKELPKEWPLMSGALKVKTSRGWHFYFKYPEGQNIASRIKVNGHNIDVRANGGYIVAPPSIHPDGGRYEFIIE